ncbi:MAG: thioesterase family protein [Bacteroidota bacterium]
MIVHETKIRVRYADTDQMGYVYYGHFARYYEIGRAELLRAIGFPYKRLEDEGVMCPVAYMQIRYLRAPIYDEQITIKTTLREMPINTVTFHTEIFLENGKLANAGYIRLAFVDAKNMTGCKPPRVLLEILSQHFEESAI